MKTYATKEYQDHNIHYNVNKTTIETNVHMGHNLKMS